ncbi:MAG: hypothetical protein ACOZF0_00270 [Thermodesulfobacteriota bacterium]
MRIWSPTHGEPPNEKYRELLHRFGDKRKKTVIFLSHCILNENTRYPGGACRAGCLAEIVHQCIDHGLGMVQLPCPEQSAWGGVSKRLLLMAYGADGTILFTLRQFAVPLIRIYSRWMNGRIATRIVRHIQDYLDSGFSVRGIVGIDGSPTCGVDKILDFRKSFEVLASMDITAVTATDAGKVVRECLVDGEGFFIQALRTKLNRRRLFIPFLGHNLIAELAGEKSNVIL